ncbi:MAG TPA: DUF3800 domain-containing protein [Longimicrobium sp.]|nr:DUF3800 domain-containing protein [Longimicrobium sp.]
MYLFYIDESGNTGSHVHPTEPVHWLVAVAVHACGLRTVEGEMLSLAAHFFGDRARDPDFEFHGSDLFTGRRECRGISPAQRVELYRALAAVIGRNGCGLFVRGVDKAAYRARAAAEGQPALHPHLPAFRRMAEGIDGWLGCRPPESPSPPVGLLVADEQREVDRVTVRSFAGWRAWECLEDEPHRTIRHLVDTVHYIPSVDSWLLQLADCVAYLRNRYEKVMRAAAVPGYVMSPADREIVCLWERFCAPAVESEEIWP